MASDVEEIQREIEKTRERLRELQHRLKTKYPKASPDKELLSLVGVLPNPGIGYKEAVRRVVAERYVK